MGSEGAASDKLYIDELLRTIEDLKRQVARLSCVPAPTVFQNSPIIDPCVTCLNREARGKGMCHCTRPYMEGNSGVRY